MSDKLVRIKNRYDTFINWCKDDPVLAAGEIAITSDYNIIKVGDGKSCWTNLKNKIASRPTVIKTTLKTLKSGSYSYYDTWSHDGNFKKINNTILVFIDGFMPIVMTTAGYYLLKSISDSNAEYPTEPSYETTNPYGMLHLVRLEYGLNDEDGYTTIGDGSLYYHPFDIVYAENENNTDHNNNEATIIILPN